MLVCWCLSNLEYGYVMRWFLIIQQNIFNLPKYTRHHSASLRQKAHPMTVRFLKDNESSEISRNKVGKMHSKPLIGTVQSVRALCREVARLGLALGIAWLCEYHPLFPHSTKYWQKDLYYFLCLLLLLYSLCNRKQLKSPADVLNREQTEEWKGWMQFMFLLYHYYKADEVYNSIRVMITCYVWMTGFGNIFHAIYGFGSLWRHHFGALGTLEESFWRS